MPKVTVDDQEIEVPQSASQCRGWKRQATSAGFGADVLALLLGISLVLPAPAWGAPSPVPSWEQSHLKEGDIATRALYILAVCIRNRRLQGAQAMLETSPGTPEERAAIRLVLPPGEDECLLRTNSLTIRNTSLLRGALAEAIYNGRAVRPRSAAPLSQKAGFVSKRLAAAGSGDRSDRVVALCAVERQPQAAHRVVQFNPGAIGEYRALKALDATFASCLPVGATLPSSRLGIRAQLAEALYHAWRAQPELFITRK